MSKQRVVRLEEAEHKELLTILVRYSTGNQHWAVSSRLRLAITEAPEEEAQDEAVRPDN